MIASGLMSSSNSDKRSFLLFAPPLETDLLKLLTSKPRHCPVYTIWNSGFKNVGFKRIHGAIFEAAEDGSKNLLESKNGAHFVQNSNKITSK